MSASAAVADAAARTTLIMLLAVAMGAVLWLASGIGAVEPGERAVVLRWGAVAREVDSGLVLAWPRPIEAIVRVPGRDRALTTTIRRFASPSSALTAGAAEPGSALDPPPAPSAGTSGCLTGDAGLVHLTGTVVWTVVDPGAYAATTRDGPGTLVHAMERAFAASAIAACARRSVDGTLVVGSEPGDGAAADARERLRGELLAEVNLRLAELALGVSAQRVDLSIELPDDAKPAFAEVLSAGQAAEKAIATARAQAERTRQLASQARAQRIAQAAADARETVSRARVDTVGIVALARERDPERQALMRERIYRDSLDTVLHQAGAVVIVDRTTPALVWLSQLWPGPAKP
jgi:regulator of protease activity HflC (stomatin/prohibitin superfamily)